MYIVIDIPEDSYKATCDGCMLPPDVESVVQGIKGGTPFPQNHGRLIDADALLSTLPTEELLSRMSIQYAPTIIEADKAESEG